MLGSNSSPKTGRGPGGRLSEAKISDARLASWPPKLTGSGRGVPPEPARPDDAFALPALSKPERYPDHNGRKVAAGGERELECKFGTDQSTLEHVPEFANACVPRDFVERWPNRERPMAKIAASDLRKSTALAIGTPSSGDVDFLAQRR